MVLISKKVTIRLNNAAKEIYLNAFPFFKSKKTRFFTFIYDVQNFIKFFFNYSIISINNLKSFSKTKKVVGFIYFTFYF